MKTVITGIMSCSASAHSCSFSLPFHEDRIYTLSAFLKQRTKRGQVINTSKNTESSTLGISPPTGERKPVLLFVDYEVPHYDLYAGSRTNFMYLEVLVEMGLEVKFLPGDFKRVEPYSSELNRLGIETLDGEWYRDNWETWLQKNGGDIDYAFFHKPDPAIKFLPSVKNFTNAAIIYQCHDLHYLRLRRKAEVENDDTILKEADYYEKTEEFIFSNSDVLLTFSDVEEKFIQDWFPHKKVFTVPLFFYQDMHEPDRDFTQRHDLVYVGSCGHTPNRDAISWFCSDVLPLIQKKIPDIAINLVGANPTKDISSLHSESIRVLGRVSEEELEKLYQSTRMMVVPLRFGAGVKGKVIEALYNGIPIVSTAIGIEGIKGIDQLASPKDSAEEFAAEVIDLYSAPEKLLGLSQRGSKFVADNFTSQKTAQIMSGILKVSREEAGIRLTASQPDITRLIAFYLPQYHPIPENDEWWGEGFTEWRNVKKAAPLFSGHYQPHVPADLGYYDLRQEDTRIAQAELAKKYGVEGFCYYHYWFKGQRLLEHPLEELLESGTPDFPFCLCWANESWTRRWDGKDKHILMKQEYSEEDDLEHIRMLLPIFADQRYIRVNGKPLFLVYRAENIPNPARTAEIWREEARKAGVGEIYLCMVESFVKYDPNKIGFDAALEFAPDWWNKGPQLKVDPGQFSHSKDKLAEVCNDNWIHSYQHLADTMLDKDVPPYKWFRCVTPSWDNWARMQKGANIFLGSTPEKYKEWLSGAIDSTTSRFVGDERMVFINAWNEWAEGNHLEPDQKFGHGYLEATRRALDESELAEQARRPEATDKERLGQFMSELVNQDQQAGTWEKQVKKLESRVAHRDEQIAELHSSTSWRLTVPLRRVMTSLRALKDSFSRH